MEIPVPVISRFFHMPKKDIFIILKDIGFLLLAMITINYCACHSIRVSDPDLENICIQWVSYVIFLPYFTFSTELPPWLSDQAKSMVHNQKWHRTKEFRVRRLRTRNPDVKLYGFGYSLRTGTIATFRSQNWPMAPLWAGDSLGMMCDPWFPPPPWTPSSNFCGVRSTRCWGPPTTGGTPSIAVPISTGNTSLISHRYASVSVLRIRDVYPGSWFLPIPDPKTATKERREKKFVVIPIFVATSLTKLIIIVFLNCWRKKFGPIFKELFNFLPKKLLKNMGLGSEIRDSEKPISDPGSKGQKGTGSRIPGPDPQHCSVWKQSRALFGIRIRIDLALLDPDPYWKCHSGSG